MKQNKAKRAENRKIEAQRIKKLIDNCREVDPRLAEFEKQIKEQNLRERLEKKRLMQEKKLARQPKYFSTQKEASIDKVQTKETKKEIAQPAKSDPERKKQKKLEREKLNKEKNIFRQFLENHKYFTTEKSSDKKLDNIGKFDCLIRVLKYEELKLFNDSLENFTQDFEMSLKIYNEKIDLISNNGNKKVNSEHKIEHILTENLEKQNIKNGELLNSLNLNKSNVKNGELINSLNSSNSLNLKKDQVENSEIWTKERLNILHKATKQYPVGTKLRYELITEYINNHCKTKFVVKQIIQQVKSLTGTQENIKITNEKKVYTENWTSEEHSIFQTAIKTYPIGIPNRWEKISDLLPQKSIIQCQERLKVIEKKEKLKLNVVFN